MERAQQLLSEQREELEDLFSIVAHDLKRPVLSLDGLLKPFGARVVTLDVALPSPHFAVEWLIKCPDCSWGAARAFVQRRV